MTEDEQRKQFDKLFFSELMFDCLNASCCCRDCCECSIYKDAFEEYKEVFTSSSEVLPGGVSVAPYETNDKRVVNGEIVSVEYHRIDWAKCFRGVL